MEGGPHYTLTLAADLVAPDRQGTIQQEVERLLGDISESVQKANMAMLDNISYRVSYAIQNPPQSMELLITGQLIDALLKAGYTIEWFYDKGAFTICIGWQVRIKKEILHHYSEVLKRTQRKVDPAVKPVQV